MSISRWLSSKERMSIYHIFLGIPKRKENSQSIFILLVNLHFYYEENKDEVKVTLIVCKNTTSKGNNSLAITTQDNIGERL